MEKRIIETYVLVLTEEEARAIAEDLEQIDKYSSLCAESIEFKETIEDWDENEEETEEPQETGNPILED